MIGPVTRDEYIRQARELIAEGARLQERPALPEMQAWLGASDKLLQSAWGSMDRYHLAWLMVGRPPDSVRGRRMTGAEQSAYVRDVAAAKTAALRMSLKAVEEDAMTLVGEPSVPDETPAGGAPG